MPTHVLRNRLCACVSLLTLAIAAPTGALAQAASEKSTGADSGAAKLEEVVVTAQRRSETLQRAALAVSVVSAEQLQRAGVSDVTGLTRLMPSLIVQPATGTSTSFYLRGVGSFVGNAFTENPIAFNYNQTFIARPAALLGTFYDLERVEVLKGPQGTLYGRNATGGAINVIAARPVLGDLGGHANFELGNYGAARAQGALNLPLGETAALRIAGQIADRKGYLSDGYDDEEGQALRASLLVRPNSRISAVVVADYFHQGGKGSGSVLVPGPLVPNAPSVDDRIGGADPRSIAALSAGFPTLIPPGLVAPPKTDGFVDAEFWGLAANIDFDLGPATLTVSPFWCSARRERRRWSQI